MYESRRSISLSALFTCVLAAWWPFTVAAENCTPIKFRPGGSSAVVQGISPTMPPSATEAELEATVLCYEIATKKGQRAAVRLLPGTGKNVVFGIDDVVDAGMDKNAGENSHTFLTENRAYKIRVMQLFSRQRDQPFKLSVTIK